ncbi:MAG: sigma-54 dependent transcriptional regulator [Nannocystaceae bacterium]
MIGAGILLVEDDDSGRELGLFNLRKAGYRAEAAATGEAARALFDPERHDLVITDVKLPGEGGLDVLAAIKAQSPRTPVIVITAYGDVDLAVAAMKAGAVDFIGKPFNRDHLLLAVQRALEHAQLRREVARLRIQARGVERPLIHASAVMTRVLEIADRVAPSAAPVLLLGESGTGKELLARRIHVRSARADAPFVAVHCGAVPSDILDVDLFGAGDRQGRARQAEGGTLFLDALDEAPAAVQGKLLRLAEEGVAIPQGGGPPRPVDARIVAAARPDLRDQVRADLLYRLAVVEIEVPPLRARPSDIPPLCAHFVARQSGERELEIPPSLIEAMMRRAWPGNVRELENACERLVLLCEGTRLDLADLPPDGAAAAEDPSAGPASGLVGGLEPFLAALPPDGLSLVDLERRVIERVLELRRGNVSQAAHYLQIPRHVLAYRMEKYGIRRPG